MEYFYSSLIGFALGSFPSAYVILKFSKGIDITKNGSGNVGAYNAYDVSKSRNLGLLVFLIDALKGLLSVYFCLLLFRSSFTDASLALVFSVFSHCYNPWLGFKGGRGLATAAGGSLLLYPVLIAVWAIIWAVFYLARKDIIFANVWATAGSLIFSFIFLDFFAKYAYPKPGAQSTLAFFSASLLLIILSKHFGPLNESMKSKN